MLKLCIYGAWVFALMVVVCASVVQAETDMVTLRFLVTVPDDTPDDATLYLSGEDPRMGAWDGKGLALGRGDDGRYTASLAFERGAVVRFKATQGSWQTVEKDTHGGEIDNRIVTADADKDVVVEVASWANGEEARGESTLTGDIRRHDGFRSEILGNERTLLVYLPPDYEGHDPTRYPVLYMHDGQNLFDASTSFAGVEWGVDEAAERLVAAGVIEPIIIVGIYNTADRMTEYTPRPTDGEPDGYARFVVEEVKPFVEKTYRADPDPARTGIAGSSLGGLISLYMVGAYPQVFGRCGGVSPSLWWNDRWLIRRWRESGLDWAAGKRIWLDMGTLEGRVREAGQASTAVLEARELAGLLAGSGLEAGVAYRYEEVEGGRHNEGAWAGRIERILTYLYGR